uniref:Replication protein A 70 kDa DNA-binding subunit B/D first OB fold domain-containing protein n=2 Tax=Brassica oleracea var. oleracea TaxID=109376 RepID=A0A0D3B8N7_BRAOL
MSKPSTKILIDGVKPVRHNWQIRVKVLHSWKQTTAFAGNTLEFILADETGVKIAASCKRNQISRLQRELPVGEWKTIDTFAVLGISGQYRPTTHRYKLSFSEETMITKCQVLSDDHYLSLASYDDLRKIDEKKNFFLKDDSDSCTVMMLDSVAQSIIGSAATELWDGSYDKIEDPTILPQPIESLVGKSFCFGISLSTDNVNNGNTTFKVSEVWSGDKIQRIESQTETCSLLDTYSSTLSGGEVSLVDPNKESSSEGFSTPFSKRKEADADLLDMTSTSKKPCTQKIKMENTKSEE